MNKPTIPAKLKVVTMVVNAALGETRPNPVIVTYKAVMGYVIIESKHQ